MAAPNLDEINTLTTKRIMPGLADNFFKNGPVMALLKKRHKIWRGGPQVQENFIYKPMKGKFYRKGETFDITQRQTKAGLLFDLKFVEVSVPFFKEDVQVIIRGPEAQLSKVEADLANASLTMSAILEIALWRNGQNIGGVDSTDKVNGLPEMFSDGTNASYDGNTYSSYGGQVRADVSPALNSPAGLIAANVNGAINYRILEHSYQSCVIGNEHPKLGITSNRCMGFINESFQPQQRIDTVDPTIGFTGLKFKDATIVVSQYIPSQDGTNDVDLGDYSGTSELFAWLNPGPDGDGSYLNLYFAADPEYQFGFTGFKVKQDTTIVAGQILAALNATCRAPRLMRILHGITS